MASLKLTVPCVAIFLFLGFRPFFQEELSLIAREGIRHQLYTDPRVAFYLEPNSDNCGFSFCNHSLKTIVHYRLGCIKEKEGIIHVIKRENIENKELEGVYGTLFHCSSWSSNHGVFPGEACKQGKLGVVEVTFKDGTTWQLAEELTRLGEKVEELDQSRE